MADRIELKPHDFMKRMARKTDFGPAIKQGVKLGAIHVLGQLPGPPQPRRKRFPWKSLKQLLFVKLSIQRGTLVVPYERTNEMLRKMTSEVRTIVGGYAGVIGTNTVYAPYVISSKKVGRRGPQAEYHANHWWTLQGEVPKSFDDFVAIVKNEINRLLRS